MGWKSLWECVHSKSFIFSQFPFSSECFHSKLCKFQWYFQWTFALEFETSGKQIEAVGHWVTEWLCTFRHFLRVGPWLTSKIQLKLTVAATKGTWGTAHVVSVLVDESNTDQIFQSTLCFDHDSELERRSESINYNESGPSKLLHKDKKRSHSKQSNHTAYFFSEENEEIRSTEGNGFGQLLII